MPLSPPNTWDEIPDFVRAFLAAPFEKKADGIPGVSEAADVLGWRAGSLNQMWGGPRPLTNLLIGAGLGSLGGYGLGRAAEVVLPKKYFEEGGMRRRGALLGAALGSVPAAYQGFDAIRQTGDASSLLDRYPGAGEYPQKQAFWTKAAHDEAADLFRPNINRDQFVNSVMGDYQTPAPLRAATAGLIEAANSVSGSSGWVSPWDVAKIAVGAGAGLVSGVVAGKVLGLLAGLTPEGQKGVQSIGLWTGMLSSVVPRALNLPQL